MSVTHEVLSRDWDYFKIECRCGAVQELLNSGVAPSERVTVADYIASWIVEHEHWSDGAPPSTST